MYRYLFAHILRCVVASIHTTASLFFALNLLHQVAPFAPPSDPSRVSKGTSVC